MMKATTLTGALTEAASAGMGGIRLLDHDEQESWLAWSDLLERSRRAAGDLRARGLREGERVALVYPTGEEFLVAFFAVLFAGATPAPVYPPLRLGRLEEYYGRTSAMWRAIGASLVLADRRIGRLLGPAVARARPALGCCCLAELDGGKELAEERSASDLALIQFSSGTTLAPNPVALSEGAIMAQVRAFNALFPDAGEFRHSGVSWLPLYHDMGLIGALIGTVVRKAELTLLPPELFVARPAAWLRAISRYRATVSPAPNFAYGLAAEKVRNEELEGVDLSTWRLALNGAEPIAASTLRRFAERFAPFGFAPAALTPVYGLAEAALAVTFSAIAEPFVSHRFSRVSLENERCVEMGDETKDSSELVSVGSPLPGFELSIRSAAGRELGDRHVGRVWVRGPSLMEGYFGLEEESAAVLREGWLDSGDEGFLWRGELYLTGRAKETIIRNGKNYPPAEIEEVASSVAGARSGCAAVAARRRSDGSEEVVLFVERRRSSPVSSRDLAKAVEARVRALVGLAVDRVLVLDPGALPRTSSGKMRRRAALARYSAGELRAAKSPGPIGLGWALIRARLARRRFERGKNGDA